MFGFGRGEEGRGGAAMKPTRASNTSTPSGPPKAQTSTLNPKLNFSPTNLLDVDPGLQTEKGLKITNTLLNPHRTDDCQAFEEGKSWLQETGNT